MPIKSKSQLAADIAGSTFSTPQKAILDDIVLSYEDILPQITTVQRNALTPTVGQLIYNTNTDQYEYWNGTIWAGMGQSLGVPQTVKVDVSAAEMLLIATTGKDLIAAPGAGLATISQSVSIRVEFNSVPYDFGADDLQILANGLLPANEVAQKYINQSFINTPADAFCISATNEVAASKVIVKDNTKTILKSKTNPSQGDSPVTFWITYITVAL